MQTAQSTTPAPVQAETTFNFISSIGVDTHNNDGDDAYASLQGQFVSEMQYLGINLAGGALDAISLTGGGGLAYLHLLESEMSQGVRFDMAIGGGATPIPVATAIANLNALEQADPGMISFVTGQNEVGEGDPNINGDIATAQNYQDQLYAAIKADPLLSGVTDITYSIGSMNPSAYTTLGNQSGNTTDGNAHVYSAYFPPQIYDSYYLLVNNAGTPNDPVAVTETGYPDNPAPGAGLSDSVVAKYQLDNIFDLLLDGASTVEVYELLDQANDPNDTNGSEDHFGFFTADGTPKESAFALHNLTSILADPGSNKANFTPGTLSYSVSGLSSALNPGAAQAAFGYGIFNSYVTSQPIYGASYLLEKSNGTFDIAVWQEPEIWDNNTATPIPDAASPVTVTLAQTAQSVEVYDPLVGTNPIATYSDVSSVTVMVSDHPLIIEVDPFAAGTTPAPSTSPAAVSVGSGPDTMTLFVAETGQPGGAQFTVTVNGLQIGGTQTTAANAASGQAQQFTFYGDFAQGANSIVINYLNANNSTFSVDSVDINGSYVPGSYHTLGNSGSINSVVTQTTGPAAVSIGSGPNTLDLFMSENGAGGGAQFTINVDGQQIGGVQTTTANASAGQVQQFDVSGTFSNGANQVTIDYLNASNSTLYLDSATINGVGISAGTLSLSNNGDGDLSFNQANGGPGAVTLGSGADTLAVFIAERGEPSGGRFTISVDGQQYGGVQTTTADASANQGQEFDLLGNFAPGNHTVSVDYLNPNNSLLIVWGATVDGTAVPNSELVFTNGGTLSEGFSKLATPVPQAVAPSVPVAAPVVTPVAPIAPVAPVAPTNGGGGSSSNNGSTAGNTSTVTIGSGSDTLALSLSERAQSSGAQFTVSVDGQQIGGVQSTNANILASQAQTFDVEGTFSPGNHTVAINYLNAANSLLFVNNVTLDGAAVANSSLLFSNSGTASFGFTEQAPAVAASASMPVATSSSTVGNGPDTLALTLAERASPGAQFTIAVNGQQVGGVQTVTANSLTGQAQSLDVLGNFAGGNNSVSIDYLNASNSLLYVEGASIDGTAVANSTHTFPNNGTLGFNFAAPSSPAGATFVGRGPDCVDLFTAERGEPGGAQFTVSVDGQQVGGTQTVSADYTGGQEQQIDLLGNFAPGNHSVSVDYLNASNSLLFVNTATINGQTIGGGSLIESNNGAFGFNFTTPSAPPPTTVGGSGPDTQALNKSEGYYLGNAQFTVSVDGQQVGGVQTASALHGNGQSQVFDVLGNFSGSHTVSVNFLNDASTTMPGSGTDRNLYVGGASIDGSGIGNSALSIYNQGAQSFSFSH